MNSVSGIVVAFAAFVLKRQVIHREVNALQIAAGNRQIARQLSSRRPAGCESNSRLSSSTETFTPTFAFVRNLMPSSSHEIQPPVENVLFHFEFGNAVAQQSADAVGALEDRDPVPA